MQRIGLTTLLVTCLFAVSAPGWAGTYKVIYAFTGSPNDGSYPASPPSYIGGLLYGATAAGGTDGAGTIYSLDPATGTEKTLYSFTNGTDGSTPGASLTQLGNELFATAQDGGGTTGSRYCGGSYYFGCGAITKLNLKTGVLTVVYDFQGHDDGDSPISSLSKLNGVLYGTTFYGGGGGCPSNQLEQYGCGTVYSIDPATGSESVLYAFKNNAGDGMNPAGGLIDADGVFYGSTSDGGTYGYGTIFSFDPLSGRETVLHNFRGRQDGANPIGNLTRVGGVLYGATNAGWVKNGNYGTIFSLCLSTGAVKTVYAFKTGAKGGEYPNGNLVEQDGTLYGTTSEGGAPGTGILFAVSLASGKETMLHRFGENGDGGFPSSGMTKVDGVFYGTTFEGGGTGCDGLGCGTVFSYQP
jgi:uncharacterized repeat protein (TIGR03803 family)